MANRLNTEGASQHQNAVSRRVLLDGRCQGILGKTVAGGRDYHPPSDLLPCSFELVLHLQDLRFATGVQHSGTGAATHQIHARAFSQALHNLFQGFLFSDRYHESSTPRSLLDSVLISISEMVQGIHYRYWCSLPQTAHGGKHHGGRQVLQ